MEPQVELRGGGVDESPHCYKRLPEVLAEHSDYYGLREAIEKHKSISLARRHQRRRVRVVQQPAGAKTTLPFTEDTSWQTRTAPSSTSSTGHSRYRKANPAVSPIDAPQGRVAYHQHPNH